MGGDIGQVCEVTSGRVEQKLFFVPSMIYRLSNKPGRNYD